MARSRKTKDTSDAAKKAAEGEASKPSMSDDVEDAVILEEIPAEAAEDATGKTDVTVDEAGTASPSESMDETTDASEVGEPEPDTTGDQAGEAQPDGAEAATDGAEAAPTPDPAPEDAGSSRNPSEGEDAEAQAEEADDDPASVEEASAEEQTDPARVEGEESPTKEDSQPIAPQEAAMAARPEPVEKQSMVPIFVAAVGGGIVAALLGFAAARQIDAANVPEGPTPDENAAALAQLDERLGALGAQLEDVAARDMEATASAAVAPVTGALAETDARLLALSEQMAALVERVETIAMRPTATGINADEFDEALGEFRDQLNATIANAQTEIDEARAEAEKISDQAYAAEQSALARAAWGQVTTALESGAAFEEPLATLEGLAGAEIPAELAAVSSDGVPTLASLQQSFPEAARAALDAAIRAETGDAPIDRLTSFLRVQSGVRSLSPREGEDPDAILSRAEAALRNGDLQTALTEIESLEGPGREALAGWEATAQARIAALEAAQSVSTQLNSN